LNTINLAIGMDKVTESAVAPGSAEIAERIVDALMAQRLGPGTRLGEQALADLFGVSRTLVREAMMRLAARGIVKVNARRGWFVVEPSPEEVREAFAARRMIETGLMREAHGRLDRAAIERLRQHIAAERAATRAGEVGQRSWLLGDFHVCLADVLGNRLLTDILRDLTARTQLMAMQYQSDTEALESSDEHAAIIDALEAGDLEKSIALMQAHLHDICDELDHSGAHDPLDAMRSALAPVGHRPHTGKPNTNPSFSLQSTPRHQTDTPSESSQ
jgi:DNA-binding GntR family transcriptional regulator